ncbi:collagen alpha-2(I) chain-like isoform X2 [Leguminivora glycinivorella]|uniref:collagen alpha-2(I) chain-like isoform X2 n=1 Tax=Leguminivora glycinivorella TaxID=1035111 RepID=UPI00200C3EF7|nr:collagen alpha-2(I) chain-like isoform X2 [Leguminivora glycinivorella]
MLFGAACLLLLAAVRADNWRWPDNARAASVRIDTKVRFVDDERRPNKVQADEIKPPVETEGFYNRPADGAASGRYAVSTEIHPQRLTAHDLELMKLVRPQQQHYSDGTLDSLQYCKCVSSLTSSCHTNANSERACPTGQSLCCYKRPNRNPHNSDSGIFSELDDERPMLLPSHESRPGLFGAPDDDLIGALKPAVNGYQQGGEYRGLLFGPGGPTGIIGPRRRENKVYVGPTSPTGHIGPGLNKQVLVSPEGPTGVIGPTRGGRYQDENRPGVLVGPDGPTGVVGPNHGDNQHHHNKYPGVLVGHDGPSGGIGPNYVDNRINSNQRNPGILVGPGGPTGAIGPNDHENSLAGNQRHPGVLVGPNGPTGVVGPGHRDDRDFTTQGFNQHPGVLVGPEGPTGHIGVPQVLVGPGGPTGGIGPNHKKGCPKRKVYRQRKIQKWA